MKHANPFVISEFTNPSGNIVFQLYTRIDGKRFRKNFSTRAEAWAERQVQEVKRLQRETGIRAAAMRLTEPNRTLGRSVLPTAIRVQNDIERGAEYAMVFAMTKLVEIQDAIQHLPPQERAELRHWILEEETPEMLAAIDVGIRSAETEPKLSAEQLRRKLKAWTSR